MKKILLTIPFLLAILVSSKRLSAQAVSTVDSLALVDLYNSTNGPNWVNHTNWLTSAPVSTWFGVFLNGSTNVQAIALQHNNLVGTLPASLGNFTALPVTFDLSDNRISGSIPSSFTNLYGSFPSIIVLERNQLSGPIPPFNGSFSSRVDLSFNRYTFATIEPYALLGAGINGTNVLDDTVEADLPLIQNGNTLTIAAGGTLSNNTYTWYKNGVVVAVNAADSTFAMTGPGTYSVSVTNAVVPHLTLYSIQNINTSDSLALVDLYNSTAGANWLKNFGWATSLPVSSWDGVECRFGRVQQLYLPNKNLNGPLPSSIGNLQAVTSLTLSSNQITGSIPASLGNLSSMVNFNVGGNQITGNIPPELGNLTALSNLTLSSNQITGSIPASLGNLAQLRVFDLDNNQLTGSIPAELGNLTQLYGLSLANNQLSDTIPSSIGNLVNLSELDLSVNQLTGTIPYTLDRLQHMYDLHLYNNKLTGPIPDSLCHLPNLGRLYLWNNELSGRLPDSITNDTTLIYIRVQNNNLTGPINADLTKLHHLDTIDISGNRYNFSVVPLPLDPYGGLRYAPQQNIPLTRVEANLSVSPGGNRALSTYTLFKNGTAIATQTGDSSFSILGLGNYNIVATNTGAPLLSLYSDTLKLGLVLPDSSVTSTQDIAADTSINLVSNIFLLASLTPTAGANGLSGSVTAIETVDSSIQTFAGTPYVERHYDITPATNASNAQATVTLYYTQADFDTYNAYVTANKIGVPLLPTGGVDNGHVLITQYHGSFTGSSSPGNYSQGAAVIHPTVAWDSVNLWWTVTFPVSGFSGFFLGSSSNPLPLTLLQFTGIARDHQVKLQWETTDEVNTRQFIVTRSADGNVFDSLGTIAAQNTATQNDYVFVDNHPSIGNNFYRLTMQDFNGQFTYSPIVQVAIANLPAFLSAYPNPARTSTSLIFNASRASHYAIEVSDANGNVVTRLTGAFGAGVNKIDIDVRNFARGTYNITVMDKEHGKQTIRLFKE